MDSFQLFSSFRYDPQLEAAFNNPKFAHAAYNHSHLSPCYMLDFHRDRILRAAQHWDWPSAVAAISGPTGLAAISSFVISEIRAAGKEAQAQGVRLTVSQDGSLSISLRDVPPASLEDLYPSLLTEPASSKSLPEEAVLPRWTAYLDNQTTPDTQFTHYKTTKREMYDAARARHGIIVGQQAEVLLVNPRGEVMEGSTTTPYFWHGGKWVTPPIPPKYTNGQGSGGQDGTSRRWALESGFAMEQAVPINAITNDEIIWLSNGIRGFFQAEIRKAI